MNTSVVDRFLDYVKFDTQSDELTNLTPSTPGQMIFAKHLEKELRAMHLADINLDDNGYLMARLPSSPTSTLRPTCRVTMSIPA
jgi:tripeptide aminopeptidase